MKTFCISLNALATAILLCILSFSSVSAIAEEGASDPLETLDTCPTASFTINNNNELAGTPVSFTNQSNGAASYVWDFGDGSFSTDTNPTHIYASAGTYTVKLKAFNGECMVEFIGTEDAVVF